MAKVIAELPPLVRKGASKYPWDEWFDGKARELTSGDGKDADFKGDPDGFRRTIYSAASRLGFTVVTRLTGEKTIALQASKNGGKEGS